MNAWWDEDDAEEKQEATCPLCDRMLEPEDSDRHHLIPKQKGGKKGPCVDIHLFCHRKIHSLFTNQELAKKLNTIEALRAEPEIEKFVEWVSGKPSSYNVKNDQSGRMKGKRGR